MKKYKEVLESVKIAIKTGSLNFPEYKNLDYTGVGFGYNLKESYPKTNKEAKKDAETPLMNKLLQGVC